MQFVKTIFLFLLTNLAVIFVLNIVLTILSKYFGVNLSGYGLHIPQILGFAFVVGFVWAFVSLFMSKWIAKRTYQLEFFDHKDLSSLSKKERVVFDTVATIAQKHNISLPEIGVYQGAELNAFATGATKNSSMVAVSSGLLQSMSEKEIAWVVGHEMAHIINGDMVTMTLMQWVVNTFVIFISRIIANLADMFFRSSDNENQEAQGPSMIYYIVSMVLEMTLSLFASILVMWFSRHREYRADEGSARFLGKENMVAALQALKRGEPGLNNPASAPYQIHSEGKGGFASLFSSHPALEDRILRVQNIIL
jgi:heat shock protein HtpX